MSAVAAMQQRALFRAAQPAPRSSSIRMTAPQRQPLAPRVEGARCLPASQRASYQQRARNVWKLNTTNGPAHCMASTLPDQCTRHQPLAPLQRRTRTLCHISLHLLQS